MIQNNHPTLKQAKALADSIKRNIYARVLNLYDSTLAVRENFLRQEGLYEDIKSHIGSGF